MSRRYVFSGVAAAVLVAGAGALLYYSDIELPWQKTSEVPSVLAHVVNDSGDRVHTRSSEFYDIEAQYPNETTFSGDKNAQAMLAMETWVRDTVEGFIAEGNFDAMTDEDKEIIGFSSGRKYALDITYKQFESPHTISYVYTVYTDTLGAHPNGYFYTFMFDKRTGVRLTLGDILDGEWLSYISVESKRQITDHLSGMLGEGAEVALFEEGLEPREGNFLNAYIDQSDIVILFDPYQVAAYAAGPQTVRIPMTRVSKLLEEAYR